MLVAQIEMMSSDEQERARADKDRLKTLQIRIDELGGTLDAARRRSSGFAPDIVDSLKERADWSEKEVNRKQAQQLEMQQNMVKQIAITLKVLQLQKVGGCFVFLVCDIEAAASENGESGRNYALKF